jgi:BirA family biotin operon repressor/biotin-[acetyl-CoA-carboxylase] ligase
VGERLRLKWPNDVLIDAAKVAGILLEAATVPGGPTNVAIGFGINVRHYPNALPYPATSLAACGAEVTAENLFAALAEAWVEQEVLWNGGRGFEAIRDRWLRRAAGLGAPIAVRIGEEVYRGTFETIDGDGRLIVRAPDGKAHPVSAGEVHFGAAATAVA